MQDLHPACLGFESVGHVDFGGVDNVCGLGCTGQESTVQLGGVTRL